MEKLSIPTIRLQIGVDGNSTDCSDTQNLISPTSPSPTQERSSLFDTVPADLESSGNTLSAGLIPSHAQDDHSIDSTNFTYYSASETEDIPPVTMKAASKPTNTHAVPQVTVVHYNEVSSQSDDARRYHSTDINKNVLLGDKNCSRRKSSVKKGFGSMKNCNGVGAQEDNSHFPDDEEFDIHDSDEKRRHR